MTPFERLLAIMIKPWVVVSCIGLIILSILYADQPIAYYFHSLHQHGYTIFLVWLTTLGMNQLYIVPLFILGVIFRYVYHNTLWATRTWFLWSCVLVPNIVCVVLKIGLGRARPDLWFSDQQYGFYGIHTQSSYWSFPSGHTTTVMGFVFGLSVLFPRYTMLYLIFGLMVVVSRVMLTQHYLSDVMVASYLALLEVGLLHYWFQCKKWSITTPNCAINRG